MSSYPYNLIKLLPPRPHAGNGIHNWLYCSARKLHGRQLAAGEIKIILKIAVAGCGRPVPEQEIDDAIRNSNPKLWTGAEGKQRGNGFIRELKWPEVNSELRAKAISISAVRNLGKLISRSPVPEPFSLAATSVIETLYSGNPWVCAGYDKKRCQTMPRLSWGTKLDTMPLIVPSAMSAPFGKPKGKDYLSPRTLNNTGPRLHLVTEFDKGNFDEQAALIWHLGSWASLAMVVFSANKSLHAWWYCSGVAEEALKKFMTYAVALGADKATWTRNQLVRMPGGIREDNRRQWILYFNPEAGKEPA